MSWVKLITSSDEIGQLTNVQQTNAAEGQVLTYRNSLWVNANNNPAQIPRLSELSTLLSDVGDYIGQTAILSETSENNDLTNDKGYLFFFNGTIWAGSAFGSILGKGHALHGIATSDSTADTPVVLLRGLIRIPIAAFDGNIAATDMGNVIFGSTTDNKHLHHTSLASFTAGNVVRPFGYIIHYVTAEDTAVIYFNPSSTYIEL